MKQILLVLVVTALAALTYVVARKLTESPDAPAPVQQQQAPAPIVPRPSTQRPNVNQGGAQPGPTTVEASPIAPMLRSEWLDAARGDMLVPADEQWWPDLSEVDFAADPVFAWEGGAISQADFQRAICLWFASPLIESLASLQMAEYDARQAGIEPTTFDEELLDKRFQIWCEARGVDAEQGMLLMSAQYKLPGPAARAFYDAGGQLALVDTSAAAGSDEVFNLFAAALPADNMAESLRQLVQQSSEMIPQLQAEGDDQAELALRGTLAMLDQIALMRVGGTRGRIGRRLYSSLDHELPEGAVLGVALSEPPSGGLPWEAPDVAHVMLDDVWPLLEGGIARYRMESVLRELLFVRILSDRLESDGALQSDADAWRVWSDEFDASQQTVLGARGVTLEILGFPSLHVARAIKRVQRSFEGMQPADWRSEDDLRAFYEGNRMFIESWSVLATVALFPAIDPSEPLARPDFVAAREAATAMAERVRAGEDFASLATVHNTELTQQYAQYRGQMAAQDFASTFGRGQISLSLSELSKVFKLDYYGRLTSCGGGLWPAISSAGEVDQGQPLGPIPVPLGSLLIDLQRVALPGLENEYEDKEFQTRSIHLDFAFMRWANGTLGEAGLAQAPR